MRGALQASYLEKEELENLVVNMEFDSFTLSGECAAILEKPLRMPMLTFWMELGRAHSQFLASLTRRWSTVTTHQGRKLYGSSANGPSRYRSFATASS